ncbi:MAG: hypothetical protein ACI9XO_003131 [Paraglaciecola sp.]|jgi:hypothetical protein
MRVKLFAWMLIFLCGNKFLIEDPKLEKGNERWCRGCGKSERREINKKNNFS